MDCFEKNLLVAVCRPALSSMDTASLLSEHNRCLLGDTLRGKCDWSLTVRLLACGAEDGVKPVMTRFKAGTLTGPTCEADHEVVD